MRTKFFIFIFFLFSFFLNLNSLSVCPCESTSFHFSLTNANTFSEEFSLSVYNPNKELSVSVPSTVEVPPASAVSVYAFVTPSCNAHSQTASFSIIASAQHSSRLIEVQKSVEIKNCAALEMHISSPQKICAGASTRYKITLKNSGDFPEKGILKTDLPANIYLLPKNFFDLAPGEEKQFSLYISTNIKAPAQTIPFTIYTEYSTTNASASSYVRIEKCGGLSINSQPYIVAQAGGKSSEPIYLTNTGKNSDAFSLSVSNCSFAKLSRNEISIIPAQKKTILLILSPSFYDNNKIFHCVFEAVSKEDGAKYRKTIDVRVENLYSASIFSSEQFSFCAGDPIVLHFNFLNRGKDDYYELNFNGIRGTLSRTYLYAKNGENVPFYIRAPPLSPGNYKIRVVASSYVNSFSREFTLNISDCYSPIISIPEKISMCPCESIEIPIKISNRGNKKIVYPLSYSGEYYLSLPHTISLNPQQTKELKVAFKLGCDASPGDYNYRLFVGNYSKQSVLEVLGHSQCSGLSISVDGDTKATAQCTGKIFKLHITNHGLNSERVFFSITGPEWAHLTPSDTEIDANSSKDAYVYVAPPFGTPQKRYSLVFTAKTADYSTSKNLYVDVVSPELNNSQLSIDVAGLENLILEKGIYKQFLISVHNKGARKIQDAMFVFPRNIKVEQAPFSLSPFATRQVSIMLLPREDIHTTANVVLSAAEGEKKANAKIETIEPTVEVKVEKVDVTNTTSANIFLSVKNLGPDSKISLLRFGDTHLHAKTQFIKSGGTRSFSFSASLPANRVINSSLFLSRNGITYSIPLNIRAYSPFSGFFVAVGGGIILFALILAFFAYSYYLKREDSERKARVLKIKRAVEGR